MTLDGRRLLRSDRRIRGGDSMGVRTAFRELLTPRSRLGSSQNLFQNVQLHSGTSVCGFPLIPAGTNEIAVYYP